MRGEASGIFHVQLFGGGNWWCTWDGRPFLALRSDCAKIRRNSSRGHFVSKHQWLAHYRFFCCAHRARWSHLVDSEFPPVFIGVLGGYTTFSSFSLQTLALARDGEWLFAALNAIGSFVLCLFAVWLGDYLALLLNQR